MKEEIELLKEGLKVRHVLLKSVLDQIAAEDVRIKRLEEARHQEEAAAAASAAAAAGLTPAAAPNAADGLHAYGSWVQSLADSDPRKPELVQALLLSLL